MAKITAGIGCSHVPAIGAAFDQGLTQDAYWKPLFDGYEPAREWIKKHKPDVAILVYNDHGSALTLDLIPTLGIGVADEFQPADEGWGPRQVPVVKGHSALAWHITESLITNEFDMCVMNKLDVDHGLTVPLNIMCGKVDDWPFAVIPVPINVVMFPIPTGDRCWRMGEVIRRAVESFPEDLNVVIFGTGGMSHQIHGERSGMINRKFDTAFLDDLSKNPQRLRYIKHEEYTTFAGAEGIEMVMWMVMRAALGDNNVHEVYRHYHVPASNTAAGLIILENDDLKKPQKKSAKKAVKKAAGKKTPAAKKPAGKKAAAKKSRSQEACRQESRSQKACCQKAGEEKPSESCKESSQESGQKSRQKGRKKAGRQESSQKEVSNPEG